MQAPLVMPSSPFSPVRIGNIYQRFGSLESGLCQNIIKASVPFVLEEGMYTYATGHACDVPNVALKHFCTLLHCLRYGIGCIFLLLLVLAVARSVK